MQQLQFESSWDKQLAPQDRINIEKIFRETKDLTSLNILFSPIREAFNHKEALLVSVLVHNFADSPLVFHDTKLAYSINGDIIAERTFTLPNFVIPAHTSMPWTFIFPKGSYQMSSSFKNGTIKFS
jgi:SLAP domain-containing protein